MNNDIKKLEGIATCEISDALSGFSTMDSSIQAINEEVKILGRAITVKCKPSDNLILHKAIDIAKEGDVIVVDTSGTKSRAMLGEMMMIGAMKNKIEGMIIDGGVRDIKELREMGAPIFYKQITPAVATSNGPGELNIPINCGGVVVNPGDIIVGDENGVVVVGKDQDIDKIVEFANNLELRDKKWLENMEKGNFIREDLRNRI